MESRVEVTSFVRILYLLVVEKAFRRRTLFSPILSDRPFLLFERLGKERSVVPLADLIRKANDRGDQRFSFFFPPIVDRSVFDLYDRRKSKGTITNEKSSSPLIIIAAIIATISTITTSTAITTTTVSTTSTTNVTVPDEDVSSVRRSSRRLFKGRDR